MVDRTLEPMIQELLQFFEDVVKLCTIGYSDSGQAKIHEPPHASFVQVSQTQLNALTKVNMTDAIFEMEPRRHTHEPRVMNIRHAQLVEILDDNFSSDQGEVCLTYTVDRVWGCWTVFRDPNNQVYWLRQWQIPEAGPSSLGVRRTYQIPFSTQGIPRPWQGLDERQRCLRLLYLFRRFVLTQALMFSAVRSSSRSNHISHSILHKGVWFSLCTINLLERNRIAMDKDERTLTMWFKEDSASGGQLLECAARIEQLYMNDLEVDKKRWIHFRQTGLRWTLSSVQHGKAKRPNRIKLALTRDETRVGTAELPTGLLAGIMPLTIILHVQLSRYFEPPDKTSEYAQLRHQAGVVGHNAALGHDAVTANRDGGQYQPVGRFDA